MFRSHIRLNAFPGRLASCTKPPCARSMNCLDRSPEPSTPCGNAGTVRNDRVGPGCNSHENETSADRGDERRTERCECERSRLLRLLYACGFTASAAGRERSNAALSFSNLLCRARSSPQAQQTSSTPAHHGLSRSYGQSKNLSSAAKPPVLPPGESWIS
jgi:hypothetical protein